MLVGGTVHRFEVQMKERVFFATPEVLVGPVHEVVVVEEYGDGFAVDGSADSQEGWIEVMLRIGRAVH